jgi:hypothetical protein
VSGWDGMGGFSFPYNWVNDAANNIDITASRMDTQFATAVSGFDLCLTRDGQGSASANLPMNGNKLTGLGAGSSANDSVTYSQLLSTSAMLTGFLAGLTLSTAGSSGTFGVAAGVAVDSTSALFMSLASAFTKTTGSFASGTGNGGLDAGSIANSTWYHVFLIGAPSVTSDILFSLSPTGPTMPAGFTLFRRIGSIKTDSSAHWVKFSQRGNSFLWDVPIQDVATTTPANGNAILTALTVPSGIQTDAMTSVRFVYNSTVDWILITSPDQADTQPTSTVFHALSNSTAIGYNMNFSTRTNTASQIRFRMTLNGGGTPTTAYEITTSGWTDTRGQG